MAPSEDEVLSKLRKLLSDAPDMGKKRLLSRLNAENGWDISSKDFRPLLQIVEGERTVESQGEASQVSADRYLENSANASGNSDAIRDDEDAWVDRVENHNLQRWEVSPENRFPSAPSLPKDAYAAQAKYYDESTRYFILYGRGEYDYGITPNADSQVKIKVSR